MDFIALQRKPWQEYWSTPCIPLAFAKSKLQDTLSKNQAVAARFPW